MADIVIHDSEAVGEKRKKRSKQIVEKEVVDASKSNVVYVGRIPHGFYEKEMKEFFEQFGTITKLRISRNKLTAKSKHYGFIQFEVPEVAAIAAESMNNYLLMESMLQVKLVPLEKLHPKMWVGANRKFKVVKFQEMQRKLHNKVRTAAEQKKHLKGILKKDKLRRAKLKAAGIDFNFPDIRDSIPAVSKMIEGAKDSGLQTDSIPAASKKIKVAKHLGLQTDSVTAASKKIKVAKNLGLQTDSVTVGLKKIKVTKDSGLQGDSVTTRSKKLKVTKDSVLQSDSLTTSSKKVKVTTDSVLQIDSVTKRSKTMKVTKDSGLQSDSVAKRSKKIKVAKDSGLQTDSVIVGSRKTKVGKNSGLKRDSLPLRAKKMKLH